MQDWSRAFGGARIYLHAADQQWIVLPAPEILLWEGETLESEPRVTLIRLRSQFAGSPVLHRACTEIEAGALLAGETVR